MDTIYISALHIKTIIGVFAWERQVKQTIVLNIAIGCDIRQAANSDDISASVDYKAVIERLLSAVGDSQFNLIESLAEYIADLLLNEFQINYLKLRLAKPNILNGVGEVSIMIERNNDHLTAP